MLQQLYCYTYFLNLFQMGTDFGPILIFEICYSDNGVKSIVHCEMLSSDVWKKTP